MIYEYVIICILKDTAVTYCWYMYVTHGEYYVTAHPWQYMCVQYLSGMDIHT